MFAVVYFIFELYTHMEHKNRVAYKFSECFFFDGNIFCISTVRSVLKIHQLTDNIVYYGFTKIEVLTYFFFDLVYISADAEVACRKSKYAGGIRQVLLTTMLDFIRLDTIKR